MNFLYRHFINGLIVIVPIAITAFVIINILNITENMLGYYLPIKFPGIGLLTVLCLIVVIGWLSSYLILRRIFEFGERILNKIPLNFRNFCFEIEFLKTILFGFHKK